MVWANYNDSLVETKANYFLFKTFSNGIFSLFAYDSTKKINFAGYGKYEFDGDKLHETFIYHTDYVGAENWQNVEVRGDTMYMNGFKKVVIGGKEVMTDFSNIKEKLVKVKMVAVLDDKYLKKKKHSTQHGYCCNRGWTL